MSLTGLYYGKPVELVKLFNTLKSRGYKVIGPKVVEGVIRLEELGSYEELAKNVSDIQEPGRYRLVGGGKYFRHGPDSPKKILYPPRLTLFRITKDYRIEVPEVEVPKIAFFALKPCDLAAIQVMDRVQGCLGDAYYNLVRKNLVIVVENCVEPGGTCFCATMGTGPIASKGFDVAFTRIRDDLVVFEAGSSLGVELLDELELEPLDEKLYREFIDAVRKAYSKARPIELPDKLPELLELTLDSDMYKEIAEKCLGCANCNMVCPTCFCFDVIDIPYYDGSAERVRVWDGCFSYNYAAVAGGHYRPDLWARYRHWFLHKFSYWVKQFGTYGCVGCGRCITWCPVGIDVRDTLRRAIKEAEKHG